MTDRRVRVGLADARVTTDGTPLGTSGVGSCLAVAAYTVDGTAGLLHAMVPAAPDGDSHGRPAKYVDTGLSGLLDDVSAAGEGSVRVKLTGGATMFSLASGGRSVGERNAESAAGVLRDRGVPVDGTDLGGSSGRSVLFDPATRELRVRRADGATTVL